MKRATAVWLVALIVAVAAGWALWREAPVSWSTEDLRLLASISPVLLWGIAVLFFGPRTSPKPSASERASLQTQLAAVMAALQERRLAGRRARYSVPFYVVLGPPGMGKTSLILHSGLDFNPPVSVGDTTWWVGDDAVFIEATLDRSAIESAEELFALLTTVRPLLPINGVLLVVSPADLTLADQIERRDLAGAIGIGIRSLEEQTGTKPPVYVILTKLDLMPGFTDFFDRLDAQERTQPWGFSLPAVASGEGPLTREQAIEGYAAGFRQLVNSIRTRLIDWMSRELDSVRGGRVMNFGAQIGALEPMIRTILEQLLPAENQKTRGAFLRGVFLTSSHQDALIIDALLPQLAGRFAMPRTGMLPPDLERLEDQQDYFISGTVHGVILSESGLIARKRQHWIRHPVWGGALATLIVLACIAGAVGLQFMYWQGQATAADVETAAAPLGGFHSTRTVDLVRVLTSLDRLHELANSLPGPEAAPILLPGFSTPYQLKSDAQRAYDAAIMNSLVPQLAVRLEADLVDLKAAPRLLRRHLAAARKSLDRDQGEALREWLEIRASAMTEPSARVALQTHGEVALKRVGQLPIDDIYVETGRGILAYKEHAP